MTQHVCRDEPGRRHASLCTVHASFAEQCNLAFQYFARQWRQAAAGTESIIIDKLLDVAPRERVPHRGGDLGA
jgi:hypothetical protein